MILISLISESAAALWANKLRSFLTVLGMVMGVASVITIVSTVEGLQSSMERTFDSMGPKAFMVTRFGFALSWQDYLERMKRRKITVDLIPMIERGCPDCLHVGAEAYASDDVKYGSSRIPDIEIRGETPNVQDIRGFDILLGRYFSWEDDNRKRNVAFIGYTVYERFFTNEDPIGKTIKVGRLEFTVIGVAEKLDGGIVQGMDEFVVIPMATHQKIFHQPGNPVILSIDAVSLDRREAAIDQVRVVMRSARHVPYEEKDDFEIVTPDAILSFINDLTRAFRVLLISLPLLSIVIGGIVIMNIMMISVTERTREIGIRKSIGARQSGILLQFLYESTILSLVGGLIGVALGVKLGAMVLTTWMDVATTPTTLAVILGFGISTAVGLFFGIYPALKAARLDPIKALSYE